MRPIWCVAPPVNHDQAGLGDLNSGELHRWSDIDEGVSDIGRDSLGFEEDLGLNSNDTGREYIVRQ